MRNTRLKGVWDTFMYRFNAINSMRNTRSTSKGFIIMAIRFNAINSMRNTRNLPEDHQTKRNRFNAINSMRNTRNIGFPCGPYGFVSTLLIACAIRAKIAASNEAALGFNAINSMRNTRTAGGCSGIGNGFNAINSMRNTRTVGYIGAVDGKCFNAINSMRNTRMLDEDGSEVEIVSTLLIACAIRALPVASACRVRRF